MEEITLESIIQKIENIADYKTKAALQELLLDIKSDLEFLNEQPEVKVEYVTVEAEPKIVYVENAPEEPQVHYDYPGEFL